MSSKKTDLQPDTYSHAFQDTTGRFPLDSLLREHHYRIHSRPGAGEPTWERYGIVSVQSLALATIPTDELERAERQAKGYFRGKR